MTAPSRVKLPKPDDKGAIAFQPEWFGARCFIGGRTGRLQLFNDTAAAIAFDDGEAITVAATHGGVLEIEVGGDLDPKPFSAAMPATPKADRTAEGMAKLLLAPDAIRPALAMVYGIPASMIPRSAARIEADRREARTAELVALGKATTTGKVAPPAPPAEADAAKAARVAALKALGASTTKAAWGS